MSGWAALTLHSMRTTWPCDAPDVAVAGSRVAARAPSRRTLTPTPLPKAEGLLFFDVTSS